MKIVISSGKGGTGKTFVASNLATVLAKAHKNVAYLDCDVEEPNGHLFLTVQNKVEKAINILSPVAIDHEACIQCGKCVEACTYNALAQIKDKILFFKEMCHVCGACQVVCPAQAIIEENREIGQLITGDSGNLKINYATLKTAEGGMSPRLIAEVKKLAIKDDINILDSPPGTACPVVATVKDADLVVLVTDPTVFGLHDLKLAVSMCREIGQEPVVLINRYEEEGAKSLLKYVHDEDLEVVTKIKLDRKIAEVYSEGLLVIEKLPEYELLFNRLGTKLLKLAQNKKTPKKNKDKNRIPEIKKYISQKIVTESAVSKDLVVVSGKGGTGKTSLMASFASLAKDKVLCDGDVDAADLHLVLNPNLVDSGGFSGGYVATIDQDLCAGCGRCMRFCRFEAIDEIYNDQGLKYKINPVSCEGCGTCSLVCPQEAVILNPAINGEWKISDTKHGPLSHAELGVAEENSGRLVTVVRDHAKILADENNLLQILMDGAPGTGCPVIASLTGVAYAVVVTEPTVSGLHDLKRILEVIKHFKVKAGIVVNKYDININMTNKIKQECENAHMTYLGSIPYDNSVTKAQMKGLSVIEYGESEATRNIRTIWNKIENEMKGLS